MLKKHKFFSSVLALLITTFFEISLPNNAQNLFTSYNQKSTPVYNLEIYGEHIFYVGENKILVHNSGDRGQFIGEGLFGRAYKVTVNGETRVHKYYHELVENRLFKMRRGVKILNEINGKGFARLENLPDGTTVVSSRYVSGNSLSPDQIDSFFKHRTRAMFDCGSEGNMRYGPDGKQYLIDPDNVFTREARSRSRESVRLVKLFFSVNKPRMTYLGIDEGAQ